MIEVNKSHSSKPYRFAFVMDQQVGLRTQSMNLERIIGEDSSIEPLILPVHYEADAGLLTRLPGIPSGIKGSLRGVREIRDAFAGQNFDAILWATWAAKSVPDLVAAAPAFLVMDMTPIQMEEMGALYGYSRGRARLMRSLKRRATDRLYRMTTHFFPWSGFAAASLQEHYGVPANKITVVSPGVDVDLYKPAPHGRPADGIVRVLFVGGDFARKGGDLLLRWLREQRSDGRRNIEVHAVTRDETLGPEPGLVIYRGVGNNSAELVRLYQSCDLFVLPTRADCYSLVAMEAMASGLPVVISKIGGISDIISEGETGYLVPSDDYISLKRALSRIVLDSDLRFRMGAAGLVRAQERFNCRVNIESMLNGMKSTLMRSSSSST